MNVLLRSQQSILLLVTFTWSWLIGTPIVPEETKKLFCCLRRCFAQATPKPLMIDHELECGNAQAAPLLSCRLINADVLESFAMDSFQTAIAALSPPEGDSQPATDKMANVNTKLTTGHNLAS